MTISSDTMRLSLEMAFTVNLTSLCICSGFHHAFCAIRQYNLFIIPVCLFVGLAYSHLQIPEIKQLAAMHSVIQRSPGLAVTRG